MWVQLQLVMISRSGTASNLIQLFSCLAVAVAIIGGTWSVAVADDVLQSTNFRLYEPSISNSGPSEAASTNYQGQSLIGGVAPAATSQDGANRQLGSGGLPTDTTPPVVGTVNDGSGSDIDDQSAMTSLQANWSGFSDPETGIDRYEYSLRRTVDAYCWNQAGNAWSACNVWNAVGASTSFTATGTNLALRTGTLYQACIRAYNSAGLVSAEVCSNGNTILPSFTVDFGSNTVGIGSLGATLDSLATSTVSVVSNAYNGYTIYASKTSSLRLVTDSNVTIPDISDSGCNGSAVTWPGSGSVFGFSSTDDIDGNKFNAGGTKYCSLPTVSSAGNGRAVVFSGVNTTGGASSETNTFTFRARASSTQAAGEYTVTVIYALVPIY
jgi:hypothetical protein